MQNWIASHIPPHPKWKASCRLPADICLCVDDSVFWNPSFSSPQMGGGGLNFWAPLIHGSKIHGSKIIKNQLTLSVMLILCMSHVVLAHKGFMLVYENHQRTSAQNLIRPGRARGYLWEERADRQPRAPSLRGEHHGFKEYEILGLQTVLDYSSFGANHRIYFLVCWVQ